MIWDSSEILGFSLPILLVTRLRARRGLIFGGETAKNG